VDRRGPVIIVAAAVLAGCGGSPPPLSRAEFQRRANAACARADAEVRALPSYLAAPGDAVAVAVLLADTRPILADLVRRLSRLTPPAGDQPPWAAFLRATRAREAALAGLEHAAATGDARAAGRAGQAIAGTSTEALAGGLGLPECARSVAPSG
jgi:hypothetical protein